VHAILPEADNRGVVLHPSGWIEGISMPRGWPLVPDIAIRVDDGQPKVAADSHPIIRVGRHQEIGERVAKIEPQLSPTEYTWSHVVREQAQMMANGTNS